MADDPYQVLGVKRDATDKQIRSAFLKLAKTTHPDLNPGDAKAEERFKAVNAANDLLSDQERRAQFDRGEIDAAGQQKPPPRGRRRAGGITGTMRTVRRVHSTVPGPGRGSPGPVSAVATRTWATSFPACSARAGGAGRRGEAGTAATRCRCRSWMRCAGPRSG